MSSSSYERSSPQLAGQEHRPQEATKRRGRPPGKKGPSADKKAAITTKLGVDRPPRRRNVQQGQPQVDAAAPNSPASASPSVTPSQYQDIDVGETTGGTRPHRGIIHRAGGSGSGGGRDGGGERGGDSGDASGELTAAEAEQLMSAAEQRLLDGMLGGSALPLNDVTGDENGGAGESGAGASAGAGRDEGCGAVDVGVEDVGDVARSGAGWHTVGWKRASIEDVGKRCCDACFSERLRCEEASPDRCKRCSHLSLACVFGADRDFRAGSSFSSSSAPWSAASGASSTPLPFTSEEGVVFLEGGFEEGDWDELDFSLDAVPIGDREEPVAGFSGSGRDHGGTELPWCRWVVSRIGFSPPMGRPGKAQLAGLRPGDELSHLHPEPGLRLEAGLLSRERMDRELSRLAAWSRSRKTAVSRGQFVRKASTPGNDGEVAAAAAAAATAADGAYDEADFPWKLEFRRQQLQPQRRPQVEIRDEGSMPGRLRGGGGGGRSPSRSASLTFSVFRETGWLRGGGQIFAVRVEEEREKEEGDRSSGKAHFVRGRGVDPPERTSSEPKGSVVTTDSSASHRRPTSPSCDDDSDGDGDSGSARTRSTVASTAGSGVGSGGGENATQKIGAVHGHGGDENRAEGGGGGGPGAAEQERCSEEAAADPLRLLCLPSGPASMVRRRAGIGDSGVPDVDVVVGGEVSGGCVSSDVGLDGARGGDGEFGDRGSGSGWGSGIAGGCFREATNVRRDGEERVTLALELSGGRSADFIEGGGAHADRCSHLLAGLTPDAVRLVKEHIFSFARVAYARLYGLRGVATVAAAGEVGAGAARIVEEAFAESWWDWGQQQETESPGKDGGNGAGENEVNTSGVRQEGQRGEEEEEENEEEEEEEEEEEDEEEEEEEENDDDDFSLVSKGKGKKRAVLTGDTENCEEEEEADTGRQKARKRARSAVAGGPEPGKTSNVHVDKGEQAGKRQIVTAVKAAAVMVAVGAGSGDIEIGGGGGVRPGGGAVYAKPDGTGTVLPEMSEPATEPCPGSGALAERVREFVRTPAFLWWVHELRRADALSHGFAFSGGGCCDLDDCARPDGATSAAGDAADSGGAGRRDGGGDHRDGGDGGRRRDPFVFVARFNDETDENVQWSCDYCSRRRKECDGEIPCDRCQRLGLTCARSLPAKELRARVSVPAFPAGGGRERESLRLGVKDAVSRLLPSWHRRNQGGRGQRRRKQDGAPGASFQAAVSRLLRGAPAPAPHPAGRRRCWPRSDDLQHSLTVGANISRLHRAWRAKKKEEEEEEEESKVQGRVGRRRLRASGGDGGGVGPLETGSEGREEDQEEREEGEEEDEQEADGAGSGGRSEGVPFAVDGGGNKEGSEKGNWRKDERVLGMKEWRVPPTCYVCHLPLASACECTAGSLEAERQFWEQRVAVVAGRPFQIPLGMHEYDDVRIVSKDFTPKRDTIAEHRRGRRAKIAFRMEHAVSMQNRGLLRYPLAVEPPPPPPAPPTLASRGRGASDGAPASSSSLRPSPSAAGVPEASMAADGEAHARGDGGTDPDGVAVAAGEDGIAGAAEFQGGDSDLEVTLGPAADDHPPASPQTEAEAVAAALAERPAASPSSPRLEKWPRFPSPSKAFARAAPMENPKGLLPPSPDILRFIHQVASAKAERTPALYGTLDESALVTVGVLVEEMLEELISPLVDGRTTGYKNATPGALARELFILRRIEQRRSSAGAPEPSKRPVADVSGDGSGGFPTTVGSLSTREEGILGTVFGDAIGKLREDLRRHREEEQPGVSRRRW